MARSSQQETIRKESVCKVNIDVTSITETYIIKKKCFSNIEIVDKSSNSVDEKLNTEME